MEGLICESLGGTEAVKASKKCGSGLPWLVVGSIDHVIINPVGDGDEGVVADFL